MIRKHFITTILSVLGICIVLGACSNDEFIGIEQEQVTISESVTADTVERHTVPMRFDGDVAFFDKKPKLTKSASSTWANGNKIYITFYNDGKTVKGDATYNSATGWKVTYDGTLASGTKLKSEVRFFQNPVTTEPQLLTLNASSIVYEDTEATYDFDGSELVVKANLKPKTARLRFKGKVGEKIYVTGLQFYTQFFWATNKFSTSSDNLSLTVETDGYTPYVYVEFETTDRTICLVGNGYAFTRKNCSVNMLKQGESGNMSIPTDDSHTGWLNGFYYKHNSVEYKFISVVGHKDGFFLIGETEVTKEFFGVSYYADEPIREKYYTCYSSYYYKNLTIYNTELTKWTDIPFCVPTLSQWQYAAQGGNKKVGYTYSGSNNIYDVANISISSVKQKAPNELGLYDMSGNAEELAYDEQNDKYVVCGGYYSSTSSCLPSYYRERPSNSSTVGLRLVLKPNF